MLARLLFLSLSLSADSSFRDMAAVNPVGIASSVPVSVPLFPTKPMATNTEQLSSSVSVCVREPKVMHISTCNFGFGGGKEKEKEREGGEEREGGRERNSRKRES